MFKTNFLQCILTMKKLIITADDYGMSVSINSAIEQCISAGTVHSTCVMTNMLESRHAIQLKSRFPEISVGIHWTLTEGKPILAAGKVPSLVNKHGYFYSAKEFRKRWLLGKIIRGDIRKELLAQHQRFLELAGVPAYWSVHENVHIWPTLFQFFTRVANELHISTMRNNARIMLPNAHTAFENKLGRPLNFLKNKIIAHFSSWARREGMSMSAGLINLDGYPLGNVSIEEAVRQLGYPKREQPFELIIHPATYLEPGLFGNLLDSRITEYRYFAQPEVLERLGGLGIELVGFKSLSSNS